MTTVTLPNFVENIEKGFIIVSNTFIDVNKIIDIVKYEEAEDNKALISIRFIANYSDYKGEDAVIFLNKYNQFLTFKQ
jgi:hypothetical protein